MNQTPRGIETELYEVEGPASVVEATTESETAREIATGCFEVAPGDSDEQPNGREDRS